MHRRQPFAQQPFGKAREKAGEGQWIVIAPSSSGQGYRPLEPGTPVQIREGLVYIFPRVNVFMPKMPRPTHKFVLAVKHKGGGRRIVTRIQGSKPEIEGLGQRADAFLEQAAPHVPELDISHSTSPAGTFVSMHGVPRGQWERIFGKKRKKK